VNQLAGFLRDVSSRELWEYYEGCLKILETLLAATVKLKPFGNEPSALDPAFFLVKDCQDRIFRTQRAFREQMRGRKVNFDELYGRRKDNQTDYCYFCSRPTILNRFSKVRVKIDGQTREAVSCPICRIELEQTKKVKVLYFLQNGKPVHWSETPDYSPSEDYWNLNKRDPKKSPKKLMLVYPAESET
jgi:hypothetical protein